MSSSRNPLNKALSVSSVNAARVASAGAGVGAAGAGGAGGAGAGSSAPVHIMNPLASAASAASAAPAASAGPRPPSYPRPSPRAEDVLDGDALLLDACKRGDSIFALELIRSGMVNLKKSTPGGTTPLMVASHSGLTNVVNELLVRGMNVDAQNIGGYTSLMFASKAGRRDTVRVLLAAGANVNLTNNRGNTAYTLSSDSPDIQALLLEHGARKGGKRSQTKHTRVRSKKRQNIRKMKRTYRR